MWDTIFGTTSSTHARTVSCVMNIAWLWQPLPPPQGLADAGAYRPKPDAGHATLTLNMYECPHTINVVPFVACAHV